MPVSVESATANSHPLVRAQEAQRGDVISAGQKPGERNLPEGVRCAGLDRRLADTADSHVRSGHAAGWSPQNLESLTRFTSRRNCDRQAPSLNRVSRIAGRRVQRHVTGLDGIGGGRTACEE